MAFAQRFCTLARRVAIALCFAAPLAAGAAMLRIASAFDPQTMDPHGLALLYHSRVVTQVYESLVNRDEEVQARTIARAVLADAVAHALALQAAPGSEVPRRQRVHRRRRGVLDRGARWGRPRNARSRSRPSRRSSASTTDGRLRALVAGRGAARKAAAGGDDEPRLVQGPRRRARAGLQRQAGDFRGAQRDGHRALPPRELPARRARAAQAPRRLGGAAAMRATATSTRSASLPSARTQRGWRRWRRAKSTW